MNSSWQIAIDITYIFIFMLIAKLIKEKLGIFNSIIVPTSLLAGFIGVILGQEVLGWVWFNQDFYENLVYHGLGIGFIALTLSNQSKQQGRDSVNSGLFIISSYCFQGVLGMIIISLLMMTIKPDLFFGLGLILPLAYGQGPGFASNIGATWDATLGIGYANQYGLTLATVGFLVGGILGLILLNIIVYHKNIKVNRLRTLDGLHYKELTLTSVKEINFFDNLTTQIVWISVIYFLTLTTMHYTSVFLSTLGNIGQTVGGLINGFNYLFGILYAILFKVIMGGLNKKGHRTLELMDGYIMHNISSLAFHVMITCSVLAISFSVVKEYWEVLIAISIGGAIGTLAFVIVFGKIAFNRYPWYYILAMFGMMTGTASTALALLRGVDPELETDVASNLVLGSAVAAPLGLPLMVLLALPAISYVNNTRQFYYIAFFGILAYLVLVMSILTLRSTKERRRLNHESK